MKIVYILLLMVDWYPLTTGLPSTADLLSDLTDDGLLDPLADLNVEDTGDGGDNDMAADDGEFTMTLTKIAAPKEATNPNITEEEAEAGKRSPMDVILEAKKNLPMGRALGIGDGGIIYQGDILVEETGGKRPKNPLRAHMGKMLRMKTLGRNAKDKDDKFVDYAMFRWHKKLWRTRVIPYDVTTHNLGEDKVTILKSLKTMEKKVPCLTFRPKTYTDKYWLEYLYGDGCYSGIGTKYWAARGATMISIGFGCGYEATIIHETMHALGFPHEQSRRDRKYYVKYFPEATQAKLRDNFRTNEINDINDMGTPYDYKSIMHYTTTAFAIRPPNHVLENKDDPQMPLSGEVMSPIDIKEINLLYQCASTASNPGKSFPWSEWSTYQGCMCNYQLKCGNPRVRFCMKEQGECIGDEDKNGVDEEALPCTQKDADMFKLRVDGKWSKWGRFSKCSGRCGWGIQRRTRVCNNPSPKSGGLKCPGFNVQLYVCRNRRCTSSTVDTAFTNSNTNGWKFDGFKVVSGRIPWPPKTDIIYKYTAGPVYDHTREVTGSRGAGYYAAAWGNGWKRKRMSHYVYSPRTAKCLSFYYMMNGEHINETRGLTGYIRTAGNDFYNLPIHLKGHQGNYWKRIAMTIPKLTNTRYYQIVLEANFKLYKESAIAIDDIFLDHAKCLKNLNGCKDLKKKKVCKAVAEAGCNDMNALRLCCETCQDPKYYKKPGTVTWKPWGNWGSCSVSCGKGRKTRKRICSKNKCAGAGFETASCVKAACKGKGKGTSKGGCVTSSGLKVGEKCAFPFTWRGKTCPGPQCCNFGNDPKGMWCSTKVDGNGKHIADNWGYCSVACAGSKKKGKAACVDNKAYIKTYCNNPSMVNYCTDKVYGVAMKKYCCATCKAKGKAKGKGKGTSKGCKDKSEYSCDRRAKGGQCKTYPKWMGKHCCESCSRPSGPSGPKLILNSQGCWLTCGGKGGRCPTVCKPDGWCCRKGFPGCPADIASLNTYKGHACIRVPEPKLILNSQGCWGKCGGKGGYCPDICKTDGFCCRSGFKDCPADITAVNTYTGHACVHAPGRGRLNS